MGAVEFFSILLPSLAWPAAVLAIAWWQRSAITSLLGRVTGGTILGQSFATATAPPALTDAVEETLSSPMLARLLGGDLGAYGGDEPGGKNTQVRELLTDLTRAAETDRRFRREQVESIIQQAAVWGAKTVESTGLRAGDLRLRITWHADGPVIQLLTTDAPRFSDGEAKAREVDRYRRLEAGLQARINDTEERLAVDHGNRDLADDLAAMQKELSALQRDRRAL